MTAISKTALLALLSLSIILGGCSSPAERAAITPQGIAIAKHHPYSIAVQAGGGSETGAMDTTNISDADLKAAIEDAIANSKLFKTVVQGNNGDYQLSVRVTSLTKPIFGTTFTVDMETAWSLTRMSDRSSVMRKSVKSTGTATMGEAFVAVTRLRLAVEAAARDNIAQGLQTMAGLDL